MALAATAPTLKMMSEAFAVDAGACERVRGAVDGGINAILGL